MKHDYTVRSWGHDYTITPNEDPRTAKVMGWGRGINPGDLIVFEQKGLLFNYRFVEIEYFRDPPDMWKGTVEWVDETKED